jgi:bifunctional non-homologous end joining protein LigD
VTAAPARPGQSVRVGRRTIRISHPDKVLFPNSGITKGEIVDYYRRVAPVMVPHLRGRPLMLQRLPEGLGGPVFYQKQISGYFPDWIHRTTVTKEGGTVTHVVCDDAATLVYLANQGCLTPHTWLSRADDLNRPDRMIIDLDPSTDDVDDVRFAARAAREVMAEAGLEPYLMATGSRGFHVVVPLRRAEAFDEVRSVARGLADALARRAPERLTTAARKADRGNRVYLDVLRNAYAQTAVPPFAIRPREGAPVAVPLDWRELESARPDGWTVRTVLDRLNRTADPWRGFARRAGSLEATRRWLQRELRGELRRNRG